jgi:hypothetical protein
MLLTMFQVILVAISSIMVWLSTSHRSQNRELHSLHQLINWSVAGKAHEFYLCCQLCSVLHVFSSYGNVWFVDAACFLCNHTITYKSEPHLQLNFVCASTQDRGSYVAFSDRLHFDFFSFLMLKI